MQVVILAGRWDIRKNRIIPDIINSILNKKNIYIKRPHNTRPLQHVLDVVYGYILIAENLYKNPNLFQMHGISHQAKKRNYRIKFS
jgi:CDP-glucose 4,6-dehydratase